MTYLPEIVIFRLVKHFLLQAFAAILLMAFTACTKKTTLIPDNDAPYYGDVPAVLVENYVNRLYIDLLGREPLDSEMIRDVAYLRAGELAIAYRDSLTQRLQSDTTFIPGDSSYFIAYHKRFYDMCKARLIEGVSNKEISNQYGVYYAEWQKDSINGNQLGMDAKQRQMDKLTAILESEYEYRVGNLPIHTLHAVMVDNYFYDLINMNTFNFINATFDDLYFRYPTQAEFNVAFDIIEFNTSSVIFGLPAQNKEDYIRIITSHREFYEGLIIWAYTTLLSREPTTQETYSLMLTFFDNPDFRWLQRQIVTTDEYANF